MNGAAIASGAPRISQVEVGTVPLRVSHSPTTQTPAAMMPKPIMARKPQYVTIMMGW